MTHQENRIRQDQQEMQEYRRLHTKAEPVICAHFGCGKQLSLEEQLCGTKCISHSKEQKTDIMLIIRWPQK